MKVKMNGLVLASIVLVGAIILSACTQSYSQAPAATPTSLPANLFVSPIPSADNPMQMIEEFAKGTATAAAQTAAAGGAPTQNTTLTPGLPVVTGTPGTAIAITATPIVAGATTAPGNNQVATPTNAAGGANPVATTAVANVSNNTAVPAGVRPGTYTLQSGEHPYCIARRFNVDPEELLSMSGLVDGNIYPAGTVLKIPQSGAFPGSRSLASHPATYTVVSSDETIFGIACKYGDVDPGAIASANGIATGAKLTAGQQIKIP